MDHETLNARVRSHLGDGGAPHVLHRTFLEHLAGDIAIASNEYFHEVAAEVVRFSGDPMTLFDEDAQPLPLVGSPIFEQLEVPGQPSRRGLREGLALFGVGGVPMVAYCRWEQTQPQCFRVAILARDLGAAQRMLDEFAAFSESRRAITSPLFARVRTSLNTRLRVHFGDGPRPSVLVHTFAEYQIANVAIQAKAFFDSLGAEFTGLGANSGIDFGEIDGTRVLAMLEPATLERFGGFAGYDQTAPTFEQIAIDGVTTRLGLRQGIVLFQFEGLSMFACCGLHERMQQEYRIMVVARDVVAAQRLLDAFLAYERANSIFRSRLIRPKIDYRDRVTEAEILPLAEVAWADVVLPDRLRRRIERDVLEYIATADALAANRVEPRRCFLFHGPPGTGKTFVCKLLATQLRGYTSVLITGDNLARPEAACALARSLAPALLFFEDVDLVAKDRDGTPFPTALGGLLNELDGLPSGERVYVVFTTNRLEVIEPALAQRPGRVDMIVGFPLPEPPLRRRLVRMYSGASSLGDPEVEWVVEHTDGVTPAFLREFMKEAVFTAIRAGAVDGRGIAVVDRAHLTDTFERFAELRREHNADRLLGFRT